MPCPYSIRFIAPWLVLAALSGNGGPTSTACAQTPASQPAGEEDDSADALIERLRDGRGGLDISQRITQLMDSSQRRLATRFDTGESTRQVQQQIIEELEAAIDMAKRNLRPAGSAQPEAQQEGETRRAGRRQEQQQTKTAKKGQNAESDQQTEPGGGDQEASSPDSGPTTPPARAWGNLPDRDREAVIQGFKEAFLRKYGELIEAYYRALSEEAEE